MDLEISLHVSASACQAQIFPRSKRQVVPLLPPLNSFHSVYKNALLGPHTFCIASFCMHSAIYRYAKWAYKQVGIELLNLPLW